MRIYSTIGIILLLNSIATAMTIDSIKEIRNQFTSPSHKIKINKVPEDWILTNSVPEENLLALFRNTNHPNVVLSLRVDNLERFPSIKPSLKKYINYYTKKYPRAGLEILNNPKKSIFKHYAELNISHRDKDLSTRQTIMWHPDKKVFIFSCSGKKGKEATVHSLCDKIISKMQWL